MIKILKAMQCCAKGKENKEHDFYPVGFPFETITYLFGLLLLDQRSKKCLSSAVSHNRPDVKATRVRTQEKVHPDISH
jgi:hypothetical protein